MVDHDGIHRNFRGFQLQSELRFHRRGNDGNCVLFGRTRISGERGMSASSGSLNSRVKPYLPAGLVVSTK